eukprot:Sdes_comp18842_c0_seq1m9263
MTLGDFPPKLYSSRPSFRILPRISLSSTELSELPLWDSDIDCSFDIDLASAVSPAKQNKDGSAPKEAPFLFEDPLQSLTLEETPPDSAHSDELQRESAGINLREKWFYHRAHILAKF